MDFELEKLQYWSYVLRTDIITMLAEAGSGHSAGALGLADIFSALYFHTLKHDPKNPTWAVRDRLVLSPGHTCPVLYAALAESGYFPRQELLTLRKFGSILQGHPHNLETKGVETSSGPLGQGLSQAIGMAIAAKKDQTNAHTFCILSDGEHQEGQTWEAILWAGNNLLNNLTIVVDRNYIQISGNTEDIAPLEPLSDKYQAFGWNTVEIDGNSHLAILEAFKYALKPKLKPLCIIANTIPGKGVSFMENNHLWHGKAPNKEQAEQAIKELTEVYFNRNNVEKEVYV